MTKIDAGAATPKPPPRPRQAIVLIHGIGEQRPLTTLRSFVAAFLKTDTYYSKPDTISDSYELRRFKLRRLAEEGTPLPINKDWPETDFYEYYWAHHMYGTKVSHVIRWFGRVLWGSRECIRFGKTGYSRLVWLVALTWLAVLAVVVPLSIYLWRQRDNIPTIEEILAMGIGAAVVAALLFVAQQTMQVAVVDFLGDAARYFDVNPKNVSRRYDILRGGIDILRKLHDDRDQEDDEIMYRYGRIVLVGHSLGSVIAYDILQHYWHDINDRLDVSGLDFSAVENYAKGSNGRPDFAGAEPYCNLKRFRASQHEAWLCVNPHSRTPRGVKLPLSSAKNRWLVSDLVTLGSPLAHAPLLMADGLADFGDRKRMREFSTCPPTRSRHLSPGRFTVPLHAEADRITDHLILHQAAYFALTRWTNFYFANDPVGGPLTVPFGDGIEDVRLTDGPWFPPSTHTGYWRGGEDSKAVQRLGKILRGDAL